MVKRVAIIGCGSIGSQIARAIDEERIKNSTLVSLFDIAKGNAQTLSSSLKTPVCTYDDFESFLSQDCDVVVEAASQEAARKFAKPLLDAGRDILLMSVGALADEMLLSSLQALKGRIYVPTGAIAGIDAIRAVRDLLEEVVLTTTKPPRALAGAPFFDSNDIRLNDVRKRTIIYEGPAADAVKKFPANVNVAAVLSLAGIGFDRTRVRIIADPDFITNQHEITAKGSFGRFQFTVNNTPSPSNPKTSYLAILSAIECLRALCSEDMRIGS